MKKILKIIIIVIFTVSVATGCVRFSKEDTETNVAKNSGSLSSSGHGKKSLKKSRQHFAA